MNESRKAIVEALKDTYIGLKEIFDGTWGVQYIIHFDEEEVQDYVRDLRRLESIRYAIKELEDANND